MTEKQFLLVGIGSVVIAVMTVGAIVLKGLSLLIL